MPSCRSMTPVSRRSTQRADEIADGGWVDESDTAEVNLALTLAEVLPALRIAGSAG